MWKCLFSYETMHVGSVGMQECLQMRNEISMTHLLNLPHLNQMLGSLALFSCNGKTVLLGMLAVVVCSEVS